MLEQLEKFRTEILAIISLVAGFFIGRRKSNAEAVKAETEGDKNEADAEATRVKTMLELQKAMLDLQLQIQQMYESREAQRNSNRSEQERILGELSSMHARNADLSNQLLHERLSLLKNYSNIV